MHIIFELKPTTEMDTFWMFEQSLYIVDFTNVYCASSFVCLLVELHINAWTTYQVIKMVMVGSGPYLGKHRKIIYRFYSSISH